MEPELGHKCRKRKVLFFCVFGCTDLRHTGPPEERENGKARKLQGCKPYFYSKACHRSPQNHSKEFLLKVDLEGFQNDFVRMINRWSENLEKWRKEREEKNASILKLWLIINFSASKSLIPDLNWDL